MQHQKQYPRSGHSYGGKSKNAFGAASSLKEDYPVIPLKVNTLGAKCVYFRALRVRNSTRIFCAFTGTRLKGECVHGCEFFNQQEAI